MASPHFPEPPSSIPPTPLADIDAMVAELVEKKDGWVKVSIPERVRLLRRCIDTSFAAAEAWAMDSCQAKGIDPSARRAGEEWLAGPYTVIRNLRLLAEALEAHGRPSAPKVWQREDGRSVARVFPDGLIDKLLLTGVTADVWFAPGADMSQGKIYRDKANGTSEGGGKVALVLGAGNVNSIAPMDALYKLFVDDEVVILKTNPVNDYCGPHIEKSLAPLVEAGVLRVCHGGAEQGKHLCTHADVDTMHITGSDATHDIIVWGADPEERAARKANGEPANDKPITSELGCVTPVMIVPGEWSEKELHYQAMHVASMVANNASFNCNAAKAVVTAEGWPLRARFLELVEEKLRSIAPRKSYYPGSRERFAAFRENYPEAKVLQDDGEAHVPWTIIPNVKPDASEYALSNEAFCGVLAEVTLPAQNAAEFLEQMAPFANDQCWGTLSCMLLIDGRTEKAHAAAFDSMLADLRYGGVGLNIWAGAIYGLVVTPWGAYPGHTLDDVRSGIGVVHNTFLYDTPEKSIVKAPFVMNPKPPYFCDHRTVDKLARALVEFETAPSLFKVPKVALPGLRA